MRFMVLMIPGVYQGKVDPKFTPDAEVVGRMSRFNEELKKSVGLLAVDGLHPRNIGARITFSGGKASVTDGPYIESKEVLGGYWLLEADSKEQVVEWMKKCPAEDGDTIEIRQIFEFADFPLHVQAAVQGARS